MDPGLDLASPPPSRNQFRPGTTLDGTPMWPGDHTIYGIRVARRANATHRRMVAELSQPGRPLRPGSDGGLSQKLDRARRFTTCPARLELPTSGCKPRTTSEVQRWQTRRQPEPERRRCTWVQAIRAPVGRNPGVVAASTLSTAIAALQVTAPAGELPSIRARARSGLGPRRNRSTGVHR